MNKKYISFGLALLLGLLTAYFCLYLSDGVFGMKGLKTEVYNKIENYGIVVERGVDPKNQTGAIIFWIFVIGLPFLFSRWISWRDTLINYWCYPVYWWVVDDLIGSHPGHSFLNPGVYMSSFFNIQLNAFPLIWTLFIFLIHSAVFLCFHNFWKRAKT